MRQDWALCEAIIDMDTYAELAELEKRSTGKKNLLEPEQFKWLIQLEKQAGVIR